MHDTPLGQDTLTKWSPQKVAKKKVGWKTKGTYLSTFRPTTLLCCYACCSVSTTKNGLPWTLYSESLLEVSEWSHCPTEQEIGQNLLTHSFTQGFLGQLWPLTWQSPQSNNEDSSTTVSSLSLIKTLQCGLPCIQTNSSPTACKSILKRGSPSNWDT